MSLIQYAHGKIYRLLKIELEECFKGKPFKNAVEDCFHIAGNYWSELRATIAEYKFRSEEEEILFFKTIKPLFISELEYFSLLYHTLLFCPFDLFRQKKFWERESKRLEEFKEQNREFLIYHASGRTDKDELYYLRANDSNELNEEMESYDKEPKSEISHDHIIAKHLALEKYHLYAQKKLKEISKLI